LAKDTAIPRPRDRGYRLLPHRAGTAWPDVFGYELRSKGDGHHPKDPA